MGDAVSAGAPWIIPIRMPRASVHIRADRRLAFEVVSAFGAASGEGSGSRVLETEADGRLLVEFHTPTPTLTGGHRTYRTVERVTLQPPERIDFDGVSGPLPLLRDRFTFTAVDGCTEFAYESTFGLKGWAFGWLLARLYVRPLLGRFMREHVAELRHTVEARAARSRAYPQPSCGHGE